MGLLLPCNVIVYETDDGKAYVAAINPVSALEIIQSRELRTIAEEVSEKLKRTIEKASGYSTAHPQSKESATRR